MRFPDSKPIKVMDTKKITKEIWTDKDGNATFSCFNCGRPQFANKYFTLTLPPLFKLGEDFYCHNCGHHHIIINSSRINEVSNVIKKEGTVSGINGPEKPKQVIMMYSFIMSNGKEVPIKKADLEELTHNETIMLIEDMMEEIKRLKRF